MLKIWGRTTSSNVQKVMWAIGELGPLTTLTVVGRVRTARSQYLGNPILTLEDFRVLTRYRDGGVDASQSRNRLREELFTLPGTERNL